MPDGTRGFSTGNRPLLGVDARTRLQTKDGLCAVEHLRDGHAVLCAHRAIAPIVSVERTVCRATGAEAPLRIRAGMIGNHRDLLVAPDQPVVFDGVQVSAKTLAAQGMARREYGGMARFVRLIFAEDVHLCVEGAAEIVMPTVLAPAIAVGQSVPSALRHF